MLLDNVSRTKSEAGSESPLRVGGGEEAPAQIAIKKRSSPSKRRTYSILANLSNGSNYVIQTSKNSGMAVNALKEKF